MISDNEYNDFVDSLLKRRSSSKRKDITQSVQDAILDFFQKKEYSRIVHMFHSDLCTPKESFYLFEVAYSLAESANSTKQETLRDEAEIVYEHLLRQSPSNTAVMNNLSVIKNFKNNIEDAYKLIKRAYELDPHDQIVAKNFTLRQQEYEKYVKSRDIYLASLGSLTKETDFALNKLNTFVSNVISDPTYSSGKIPIPAWKFRVFMSTDKDKADSLKEQWLDKSYIRLLDEKGEHGESVYELNPFLKPNLDKIARRKVNQNWIDGINALNPDSLDQCAYFETVDLIAKINKKYRSIVARDFDELVFNYVMKNNKSIIVLAGSLVETLLMYQCEKKHLSVLEYERGSKIIRKKLNECDLGDLLSFAEQHNFLGDLDVNLANISRIHRNYVHPGKELRETDPLDYAKANLCFICALELIKHVIR